MVILPSSAKALVKLDAGLALILKYPAAACPGLVPEKLPKKLILSIQASYNPTSNLKHISNRVNTLQTAGN